jgi:hypothetical protein
MMTLCTCIGDGVYLLRQLGGCCQDVLSYLSFALQTTSLVGHRSSGVTQRLEINEMEELSCLLDVLCDTVSLIFADPNYNIIDFEASINIVMSLVQKLTEETSRLNGKEAELLTAHESFSRLLCLVVSGRCLHLLRSITQRSSTSSDPIEHQKSSIVFSRPDVFSEAFAAIHATQAVGFSSSSDNNEGADIPAIMHDMRQRYQSFGKYYDAVYSSRWLGMSSALHLMRLCDGAIDGALFAANASTGMCSNLLEEACEQVGLCSKESVSHMLNCARLLLEHLHALHGLQQEDSVSGISERLEELLFAAWTACTDGDGVCYQNVKLFIQLCFDKNTLQVIDSAAQQVGVPLKEINFLFVTL